MNTTTIVSAHPWQTRFGAPPYRFVAVERKVHKSTGGWLTMATEQPAGTCDVCGTGIMYCYRLRSANGTEFVVGSDCIRKAQHEYQTLAECDARKVADAERAAKAEAKLRKATAATLAMVPDAEELLRRDNLTDRWLVVTVEGMLMSFRRTGKLSEKQVAWLRRMPRAAEVVA